MIEHQLTFPYQFLMNSNTSSTYTSRLHLKNKVIEWCNDNCVGIWSISVVSNISFYSSLQQLENMKGVDIKPGHISTADSVLIMFNTESMAMAFKLHFSEQEIQDV